MKVLKWLFLIGFLTGSIYAKTDFKMMNMKFETSWESNIEGELIDVFITEKDEDVIALTEGDDCFHLYYFKANGNLKWHQTESPKIWSKLNRIHSSENGETIIVQALDSQDEIQMSWVYNNFGKIKFKDLYSKGWYYTSPQGRYLNFQPTNNFDPFIIYNTDGSIVNLNLPEFLTQQKRQMQYFLSDEEILVYLENINVDTTELIPELVLYDISSSSVKWRTKLERPLWLIDFNERNCAVSNDHIAIQGTAKPGYIYLFNRQTGNLMWKIDNVRTGYGIQFNDNGKRLVSLSDEKYVCIINVPSGKMLSKNKIFEQGLIAGVPKISFSENMISVYSSHIQAKDKIIFNSDKEIRGKYSTLLQTDHLGKVKKINCIPRVLKIKDSKLDQKQYIYGQMNGQTMNKFQIIGGE